MRQIAVLSVLLGAALVGAYITYHGEEKDPSKADQVVVYRADAADIDRITWTTPKESVQLERKLDAAGEYVWVTVTGAAATEAPAPDEAHPGEVTTPVGETGAPVSFKGSDKATALYGSFAPLYALRELTTTGTATSAAFGFDEPTGTIEVGRRSGVVSLVVGGETYGSKDRYVKLGDKVFLVDDQTLKPLQSAKTALADRMLQPLADADTDQITVKQGDQVVTLLHKNKEDRATEFWARPETPAEADQSAKTWLGKVARMRSQEYVAVEPALTPSFAYTVEGKGQTYTIEVFTGTTDAKYYARSSYTRGLVELTESVASEVVADLDTVVTPKP